MAPCIETSQANPLSCNPNRLKTNDTPYKISKISRPGFCHHVCFMPLRHNHSECLNTSKIINIDHEEQEEDDDLWMKIQEEAKLVAEQEPILSNYCISSILSHNSIERALANHLAIKLGNSSLPFLKIYDLLLDELKKDPEILKAMKRDLIAVKERDPSCISYMQCFLNFKGFLACQAHRIAHRLWSQGRQVLALWIQNRVSEIFAVDIHPGAKIGHGVLLNHATGVVIGETVVIGNNVSILNNVTLGGTGKDSGDRHPKIGDGVLIGAGTCILGNIKIGDGAKIGSGSIVLKNVPPRTTTVGNLAKLVGGKENSVMLDKISSLTMDHTSHIYECSDYEWSDYVI